MSVWTEVSGSGFTPSRPHLFREETRAWHVLISKASAGADLFVRIYDTLTDAQAANANYSASASLLFASTELVNDLDLTNNVGRTPTFTNATLRVELDALDVSGSNIWTTDLGTRLPRAVLRVHRAFSEVTIANGYFIDVDTVELGLRTWESAKRDNILPYVGLAGADLFSEETEVGERGLDTQLRIQAAAYADQDRLDPVMIHFFDDLRRALRDIEGNAYDGAVSDLPIYQVAEITTAEKDLALDFAQDHGIVEFDVVCHFGESGAEITGG
jgi:hypothetical protein